MKTVLFLIAACAVTAGCESNPNVARGPMPDFSQALRTLQMAQPQHAPMQPLNMGTNCISRYQPGGTIYTTCD